MIKTSSGKKQYVVLFCLALAVSLIMPVIGYYLEIKFMMNSSLINIIFSILNVFSSAGTAILVFTSFRYKFKYCLPIALMTVVLQTYESLYILLYNKNQIYFSSLLQNVICYFALNCAAPFVIIGISKLASKRIKKEISSVLIALLFISLFWLLANIIIQIMIDVKYTGFAFLLKNYVPEVLKELYKYILMLLIYYILKFAFSDHKKAVWTKLISDAKKLWAKTAD